MNFLEANLAALAQNQPELAAFIREIEPSPDFRVETARSGLPTLKARGISLHSAYDPAREAETIAGRVDAPPGSRILLKGFGLGYIAEALTERGFKVVVAEAEPIVLRTAFESRDLTGLLSGEVRIFAGPDAAAFREFLRRMGASETTVEIAHAPSVKLNPEFYQALDKEDINFPTNEPVSVPKGLKILLPSPLYGGSLPIAGYCKSALEALGHKVELFDSSYYYPVYKSILKVTGNEDHQAKLRALYTMFVSELVLAKALEWKPDLVFGIAQSPFTTETLAEFKQIHTPVAFWFMEDFRVLEYWKNFAPLYDHFFYIQRGEFPAMLDKMGMKRRHYLPLAADPELHRPVNMTPAEREELGSQISFVGAGYYNRQHFFLQLLDEDFKIWGTEWNTASALGRVMPRKNQRISTEDCVKIFNASNININLHSSSYHTGVNPHGDFVNPRTFEIAASGAFQLVDPRAELPALFHIGREIDTFSDIGELRRKMKYYLERPEERRAMAQAGRERVLKEHTYRHRMEEMLEKVVSAEPALRSRRESPNLARNLIKEAGSDQELREFFERFEHEEELSVDKIAQHIRKGRGELTRTEGIFLLMKEFQDWAKDKNVI